MTAAPGASAAGRALPPWAPLLVLALAWVAQGGALGGGWVQDDREVLAAGGGAGAAPQASRALEPTAWRDTREPGAWRPLATATLALEAPLWEALEGRSSAFGFRVTNLFLFGLCALLLLLVLRRAGAPGWTAGAAAAVFAAHPALAGTVAALAGRADLLALLLCLAAAAAWGASREGLRAGLPLAALLWFLALLSKETALGLPLVLLAAGPREDLRGRALAVVPFLVPLALWLLARPSAAETGAATVSVAAGPRLLGAFAAMGEQGLRLLVPVGLLEPPVREAAAGALSAGERLAALGALGVTGLAVARAVARRAGGPSRAWLAFALLAVAGALVAPAGAVGGARFAFVPSAPLFLVGGVLVAGLASGGTLRAARGAGAAAALLALAFLARAEGAVWRDESAWLEALQRADPGNPRPLTELARALREDAEDALLRSSRLRADDARRAPLLAQARRGLDEARAWAQRATETPDGKRDPAAWGELGAVLLARRELPDAERALEQALAVDPLLSGSRGVPKDVPPERLRRLAATFYRLGMANEGLGAMDRAAFRFEYAANLASDEPQYVEKAAVAMVRVGRFGEAAGWLERAVRLAPSEESRARLLRTLGEARTAGRETADRKMREAEIAEESADYVTARDLFEGALVADPDRIEPRLRAAYLRGIWFGDFRGARTHLAEASARVEALPPAERAPLEARIADLARRIEAEEAKEPP